MLALHADQYFELALKTWEHAKTAAGCCIERDYVIAGLAVRLQFAGPALPSIITPALSHLERRTTDTDPHLTVRLWDCASTNVAMPPSPVPLEDFNQRGQLAGFDDGRHYACYDPNARMVSLFDAEQRSALVCAFDAKILPTYERGAPLRGLLAWLMRRHARQVVHAACVGTSRGGVLVVGRGGSGKSNTAVGCLRAGLDFAGDDFCAVAASPQPTAHSLYSSAKLRAGDWACLPLRRANPDDPESEKNLYFLQPHFSNRIKAAIPILAVLLPSKSGGDEPSFETISPRVPLIEMASQSIAMLPYAGAEVVSTLSRVVRQVPCYRFNLGSRPGRIPASISELIETHSTIKKADAGIS